MMLLSTVTSSSAPVTAPINIKVTSSSFTSGQLTIYKEQQQHHSPPGDQTEGAIIKSGSSSSLNVRGYEVYYRISSGSAEANEWQVLPVFPFPEANHTILLEGLICGTTYHVHVTDLESGRRTETLTLRTQGTGEKNSLSPFF